MADYATLKNPFTCESCTQDIGGQEEQEDICYVTQRKPRRKVNSESNESMFEMSYQSLPNLCQQNNQDLEELKDENLKLKIELEAAHIEIESLNTQIQTLDCDKKELDRKLQLFRSVGLGTTNTIGNTSSPKRFFSPQYRRIRTETLKTGYPCTIQQNFTNNFVQHLDKSITPPRKGPELTFHSITKNIEKYLYIQKLFNTNGRYKYEGAQAR